jgi:vitamin B12 transporter
MLRLHVCTSVIALAAASSALAETPAIPASVNEVVVTAERLPEASGDAPGFYVIDEAEIEARGAQVAIDVLETIPGLSVARNGAFGGVTGVRQRGATTDKTLVLVDGVPVNDPSQPSGGFDFSSFDLADVQRIEVLSGPQGSLWGSDAIGGVISFTTRELEGWRADLEVGSFSTRRATVGIGRADGRGAIGVTVAALSTDGISKAASGTEDDGFDSLTATANARFDVTLDGRIRFNDAEVETDGFPAPAFALADTDETATSESWFAFGRARATGVLGLDHALSLSVYDLDRAALGGDFPSRYTAERQVYRYQAERRGGTYQATVGAEREDTEARLSDGSRADLGATSAFGVVRLTPLQRLSTTLSVRYDDPDEVEAETTARAAVAYEVGAGFTARASYGQGFKTPTISQLACDFCFPAGPADLKPERAEGYDLGVAWTSADQRVSATVTGYELRVRDQIDFAFDPVTFGFRYRNLERTRSRGVEAEAEAVLAGGFGLRAAYAYTEAEDRTTGDPLPRVPEHQGSAVLTWSGERFDGALTFRAEGEQADVNPDTFVMAEREGFVTADLALGYALTEGLRATLRIENLSDEDHQQVLGYAEPGRAAYVGLRVRR